ncbi:cysteine dioxygenase [Burkholderia sp. AU19243]|uniref:cysteine dioxygenase family protein n=1 Tax=Burkholderia TaxID=32008 RepID=UPI001B92831D|nr:MULTISPECIES: cysteine dioxygenase [Burkholderia]MBR8141448.1 cysteine dioxygenase [Burkholderia vietnamiensis]MBR8362807.1 cysteine dioxygenase [Burkholderia sp. AU19243]MBY4692504.1 cysteine dioxygenase [Burkholderia latens]
MSTLSLQQTPLRPFVDRFGALLASGANEARILDDGGALLAALVARDDWLPDAFAQPDPARYRQYLLHLDPAERFSVVSFVWGPGQTTPVHNHTVWGLIGMLRGGEFSQPYRLDAAGIPVPAGDAVRLRPGDVDAVSPRIGDIHRVTNAFADQVSISIHVYGANIGKVERAVFLDDGTVKPFVSGYSNA